VVSDAVAALIVRLGVLEPSVPFSPEAALALALAERIDDVGNSATSVSMNAGRLLDALAAVRALAPDEMKESPLDEIRARRDRKVAGMPDTEDSSAASRRGKSS
jgi:hypothetical protein